jgi:hypothetical protein
LLCWLTKGIPFFKPPSNVKELACPKLIYTWVQSFHQKHIGIGCKRQFVS